MDAFRSWERFIFSPGKGLILSEPGDEQFAGRWIKMEKGRTNRPA